MQYHQTIDLSADGVSAIKCDDTERLNNIVVELERHINDISSLLARYHWDEKGVVNAVKIDPDLLQISQSGKGRFTVKYAINIRYGCSDIDIDLNNKMLIDINTDLETGITVLTGEYIPEREPDGF